MNKRIVLNIVAKVLFIACFFMFMPLAWALRDDPHSSETAVFIVTMLVGICASSLTIFAFKLTDNDLEKINAKDGLAIVGLSWIALSIIGALPLFLTQTVPSYTDAFFEVVSGFTTTGATVITDIEILPRGILFWRSLTHWMGGMGIIVFSLALLPALGQHAFQLYKAEAPGLTAERIDPRIKETAKSLWAVYLLLSLMEVLFLMYGEMGFFESLCHTFGTMATGGFSTKNASMGAYSAYSQWVVTGFMFLAGMNFVLHYQVLRGKIKPLIKNEEFLYYFLLTFFSSIVCILVVNNLSLSLSPIRDSIFQVVSIITTTGYTTTDFDLWPNALRFILVFLMFIGGCGGSTGGGMKVVRFFLAIKVGLRSVIQSIYPNAVIPIRFNAVPYPDKVILAGIAYFIIYIFLFFIGAILFTITENCDIVTAFSASIASLSNIGPGLGKIGATQNYAWISSSGKWVLVFLMLAGRLELYSILVLLLPSTWRK